MEKRAKTSRGGCGMGRPPRGDRSRSGDCGVEGDRDDRRVEVVALMQSSGLDRVYSSLPWRELMKSRYQVKLSFLMRPYVPLP